MESPLKIVYELVAIEVEKLYAKTFPAGTPNTTIEDHCEYIADYIEACGWSAEGFMHEYMERSIKEYNGNKSLN